MKSLILALCLFSQLAMAQDWKTSPYNWKNSESNWENSSNNWKNSPNNFNNSEIKYGNERIIRDEGGNAQGYAVPKSDGGVNFYDSNGNRTGYLPAR